MKSHLQITLEEFKRKFGPVWNISNVSPEKAIESFLTERYKDLEEKIEGMKNGIKHTHMGGCSDCEKDRILEDVLKLFRGETKS